MSYGKHNLDELRKVLDALIKVLKYLSELAEFAGLNPAARDKYLKIIRRLLKLKKLTEREYVSSEVQKIVGEILSLLNDLGQINVSTGDQESKEAFEEIIDLLCKLVRLLEKGRCKKSDEIIDQLIVKVWDLYFIIWKLFR